MAGGLFFLMLHGAGRISLQLKNNIQDKIKNRMSNSFLYLNIRAWTGFVIPQQQYGAYCNECPLIFFERWTHSNSDGVNFCIRSIKVLRMHLLHKTQHISWSLAVVAFCNLCFHILVFFSTNCVYGRMTPACISISCLTWRFKSRVQSECRKIALPSYDVKLFGNQGCIVSCYFILTFRPCHV